LPKTKYNWFAWVPACGVRNQSGSNNPKQNRVVNFVHRSLAAVADSTVFTMTGSIVILSGQELVPHMRSEIDRT